MKFEICFKSTFIYYRRGKCYSQKTEVANFNNLSAFKTQKIRHAIIICAAVIAAPANCFLSFTRQVWYLQEHKRQQPQTILGIICYFLVTTLLSRTKQSASCYWTCHQDLKFHNNRRNVNSFRNINTTRTKKYLRKIMFIVEMYHLTNAENQCRLGQRNYS